MIYAFTQFIAHKYIICIFIYNTSCIYVYTGDFLDMFALRFKLRLTIIFKLSLLEKHHLVVKTNIYF